MVQEYTRCVYPCSATCYTQLALQFAFAWQTDTGVELTGTPPTYLTCCADCDPQTIYVAETVISLSNAGTCGVESSREKPASATSITSWSR